MKFNTTIEGLVSQLQKVAFKANAKTEHDVWFEYHGHVNKVEVRAIKGGWVKDADYDYSMYCFLDVEEEAEIKEMLQEAILEVANLIKG